MMVLWLEFDFVVLVLAPDAVVTIALYEEVPAWFGLVPGIQYYFRLHLLLPMSEGTTLSKLTLPFHHEVLAQFSLCFLKVKLLLHINTTV